jgi:Asp-tRNA(Asn)/Glu-tRNA(Gln) amidotransferase A subunit family amidase
MMSLPILLAEGFINPSLIILNSSSFSAVVSIPSGTVDIEGKKLPLGIQITGRHGDEDTLFEAGKDFLGEK